MERVERLRAIARHYYSRRDIQRALVLQAPNREVVPRYFDIFGKRPDVIEYENDVFNLAMNGATSFHCSEELWSNPLKLTTSLREEQLAKLRLGWDLLIDVDCKFLEYSKIAAWLLCEALYFHNIRNFGLKFSGGSGWHIGLSFNAFPKELNRIKMKDFFPQGPRLIAGYLKSMIENDLRSRILELSTLREIVQASGKPPDYFMKKRCKQCNEEPIKKRILEYFGKEKTKKEREELVCPKCHLSYSENKNNFLVYEEFSPFSILELDTVLISSRHLYRMAYSLNEKTGLVSAVIKPEQLKAFHLGWAQAERVLPKTFLLPPERNEALELLRNALDWNAKQERKTGKEEIKGKEKIKPITAGKISEESFPPCIKAILKGMPQDGRKRALFVLILFLKSLGLGSDEIEKKILEWNALNYKPLKENYIATQLGWFKRQEPRLPPNCALAVYYKDIGVCSPDFVCGRIKNPINYVSLRARASKEIDEKKKRKRSASR